MPASESDVPLTTTLERLQAILRRKRRRDGRPESLHEMTAEQIPAEKKALQKALLQFQRRHGRPQTKQDREIVRPLYERYRQVKQLITSGDLDPRKIDEEDVITSPEEFSSTSSATAEPTTDFTPSPHTEDTEILSPPHPIAGAETSQDVILPADKSIKTGNLLKTSGSHDGAHIGPSRERRFRLTEEAVEYFQHFSHAKVRRSFPLTSIEKIEYEPDSKEPGPKVFRLFFPTDVMTLQANSREDAKDWVEKIDKAWKKWQLLPASKHPRKPRLAVRESSLSLPPAEPIEEETEEEGEEGEQQMGPLAVPLPPAATTSPNEEDNPKKEGRAGQGLIHRRSHTYTLDPRHKSPMDKLLKAARLVPILAKAHHYIHDPDKTCKALHEDYTMIKYPRRNWAVPSEKLFKIDSDNLLILWRHNQASSHKYSKCLSLHRVLEIREGQQTAKFDTFPYDEVWHQSFSIVFEGQRLKKGKYVGLTSLDLICDSADSFKEWSQGLKSLVSGFHVSSFPFQRDNTDPTVLWLKQLWSCHSSDHEITEKTAIKLARRFKPTLTWKQAKMVVKEAHAHQVHHTVHHGNAIRWDGFVAIFNLLCQGSSRSEKLFHRFRKYAKRYPQLGMTPEELKEFLINECYWDPRLCTQRETQQLIFHYDYHHRAFKKFVAQNKPSNFQIVSELLSYAGFLSFLRSKDNSAVNIKHDKVYQDMSQPMSHYFINSSHNTYLEEDQLYGRSSTDAYVRTLVQGCRCVEIDCWDDTLRVMGGGEPIIYHGYTLTTKLAFRDVIETIKDYAFNFSNYPVIISIENHCSKNQQVKMAHIFEEVMGDVLALENLVESQGRDRLPSPQELQGKILLKGSYGKLKGGCSPKRQRLESLELSRKATTAPTSLEDSGNLQSLRNRYKSVSSDSDVDVGEQSVTSLTLRFDSSEVHGIDRKQVREWAKLVEQGDKSAEDDQELVFATVPELQCLIPYCRAVSIKPWDWRKQLQTTVSEMFSFGEVSANRHCENSPREMLACSEQQLVRTYPKGVRFDSSNYDPIPMWNCGMQLVALNWQYPDVSMHLNQGLFRLNGGCGYVLKPEVMRRPDPAGDLTPYQPSMTEPHPDVTPVDLEIELLSGQRLCFWKKKCSSLTVEIHTYGIPHDTDKMQPPATAQLNNTFWPQWPERQHIYRKKVLMPELCLVYFRVDVVLKGQGLGAKLQLYGQNCISLVSLMPGIKFIPLRTPGGELIPESGLFVQIKKKKLSSLTQQPEEDSPQVNRSETLDRSDSTEEYFGGVNVTASIHPSLLSEKGRMSHQICNNPSPLNSPRRMSCPVNLEGHFQFETNTAEKEASQLDELLRESRTSGREKRLEVVAEVHGSESFEDEEDEEGLVMAESVTEFHLDISMADSGSDII